MSRDAAASGLHQKCGRATIAGQPHEQGPQIWSNNPLERRNREVQRRTEVVGIYARAAAFLRLVGEVLAEQHDEGQDEGQDERPAGQRSFRAESLAKLTTKGEVLTAALGLV